MVKHVVLQTKRHVFVVLPGKQNGIWTTNHFNWSTTKCVLPRKQPGSVRRISSMTSLLVHHWTRGLIKDNCDFTKENCDWLTHNIDFTSRKQSIPSAVLGTYHITIDYNFTFSSPSTKIVISHDFTMVKTRRTGDVMASPWRVGRVEWQPMRNHWRVPSRGSERWTGMGAPNKITTRRLDLV